MGSALYILSAAAALWPAGFVILARITARGGSAPAPPDAATVSIIIPARNEAHNLPALLQSIQAQSVRPLEILVVDDASRDQTAEVARSLGATVVASRPLPDGWRGKTWACQQGADLARGDLLLFMDADIWFEADGLVRILQCHQEGATSVGPYHRVRRPYEQLSAFFNLVMVAGIVPRGLFGQMLLVDRASYAKVGGHATVKECILENVHLARRFATEGIATRSLPGKGLLAFRMYPLGLGALIGGWTKGFAAGAGQVPRGFLALIVAWLTGMCLPLGWLAFSAWAWGIYVLYVLQLWVLLRRVGAFKWYVALFYPVPLAFYFVVFAFSLSRAGRAVTWKGRTIHAV